MKVMSTLYVGYKVVMNDVLWLSGYISRGKAMDRPPKGWKLGLEMQNKTDKNMRKCLHLNNSKL